jgi:hypothetical protein
MELPIIIGIVSYVYVVILQRPDMILSWLPKYLSKLPDWLNKPLGLCEYCVAGQLALWITIFTDFGLNVLINTVISIFTVEIINRITR